MIFTPFNYNHRKYSDKEPVLPGDQVQPDQSLSIREILDRFTRGVPAIGINNFDYDEDPEAILRDDYVFPDFPDFADYVYAEHRINEMKREYQASMANQDKQQKASDNEVTSE